jgi:site-specific recombinase XerD
MHITSFKVADFDRYIADYITITTNIFHYQPSGRAAVKCDLNLFSNFLKDKGYRHITGDTLLEFLTFARKERGNVSGTINRKISSIRNYIRHLRFRDVKGAHELPIESLGRAREPYAGPVNVLTPEEVRRLISGIDQNSVLGIRDHLLFRILYRLGLRLGEALAIDLDDIDFENEVLLIHGKGRRERTLPLVPDVADLIRGWLVYRKRLMRANRQKALFISKKGNRLAARTAQENFKKIVNGAGPLSMSKLTPHSLRHAFASHALEGDADLIVLKAVLGHARMKSTLIYLHPSMRLLRKAVNDHLASDILEGLFDQDIIPLRVHQKRRNESAA